MEFTAKRDNTDADQVFLKYQYIVNISYNVPDKSNLCGSISKAIYLTSTQKAFSILKLK